MSHFPDVCRESDAPNVPYADVVSLQRTAASLSGDVTCDNDFIYNSTDAPYVTCSETTGQWSVQMEGQCQQKAWRNDTVSSLLTLAPWPTLSQLSCKPRLFPHKLSIWPPCCTLLTGGMHNDLNMIPASKWMSFASFDCKCYLLSSVHVCHCLFWKLCLESTSLSLYCCAVGCEEYMAATILVFRVEQ